MLTIREATRFNYLDGFEVVDDLGRGLFYIEGREETARSVAEDWIKDRETPGWNSEKAMLTQALNSQRPMKEIITEFLARAKEQLGYIEEGHRTLELKAN